MMRSLPAVMSLALFMGCLLFRQRLEADPVTHMLLLLPALALAGGLLLQATDLRSLQLSAPTAAALVLVSLFTGLFWMLPRYIDASLTEPLVELAKFVSLPTLAGAFLALGWRQVHPFLRGFLKANVISMLGVLGFLYIHAPVRICNSYLVSDQERLGFGFLFAAAGVSLAWALPLFFPLSGSPDLPRSQVKEVAA